MEGIDRCSNIQYLQISEFSFPYAPIIHECTVNTESKYFPYHKFVCKNLEENAMVWFTVTESLATKTDHTMNLVWAGK